MLLHAAFAHSFSILLCSSLQPWLYHQIALEKRQISGKGLQQQHKLCNDSGESKLAVLQSEMQGQLLVDCFSQ